eukprot:3132900-Lingulodinium_polyedra.AAC.1
MPTSPAGGGRGRASSTPKRTYGSCRRLASRPRRRRPTSTRPGNAGWTCTWAKTARTALCS